MQVVPPGPKRVKLSEINDYKSIFGKMFNIKWVINEKEFKITKKEQKD